MRNTRHALLVSIGVVVMLVAAVMASPRRPAEAAYVADLGDDDVLVFMSPWETKAVYEAMSNPGSFECTIPPLPDPIKKLTSKMNKLCSGYNWLTKIEFWRVKWFLRVAAESGGCGAFVIDGASWRPDKFKVAEYSRFLDAVNSDDRDFVYGVLGSTYILEGHTVPCTEWNNPPEQSNIIRGELPGLPPVVTTTTIRLGAGA